MSRHNPIFPPVKSPTKNTGSGGIPGRDNCVMLMRPDGAGGVVDYIGECGTITLTTGTVDDIINASFPLPDCAALREVDTLLGGDALYDSADGMAPIVRYGYEWVVLDGWQYLIIGYNGIAAWNIALSATDALRARAKLLTPTIMLDSLEMTDNLRMI